MNGFEYCKPKNIEEVLGILHKDNRRTILFSGGTDFVVNWRAGRIHPKLVLDISHLSELDFIDDKGGYVSIGPATTMKTIAKSPIIHTSAKLLADAARRVGSPQIRNRATIGGNIVSASPAADTITPLLTLEATLRLRSLNNERTIPVSSFLKGPKITDIRSDEILTEIFFIKPPLEADGIFFKFGRRNAATIAVINIAVMLLIKDGDKTIKEARIGLGAVAPTPIRAEIAENFLAGKKLDHRTIKKAAELAGDHCQPISDIRGTVKERKALVKMWLENIFYDWVQLPFKERRT